MLACLPCRPLFESSQSVLVYCTPTQGRLCVSLCLQLCTSSSDHARAALSPVFLSQQCGRSAAGQFRNGHPLSVDVDIHRRMHRLPSHRLSFIVCIVSALIGSIDCVSLYADDGQHPIPACRIYRCLHFHMHSSTPHWQCLVTHHPLNSRPNSRILSRRVEDTYPRLLRSSHALSQLLS